MAASLECGSQGLQARVCGAEASPLLGHVPTLHTPSPSRRLTGLTSRTGLPGKLGSCGLSSIHNLFQSTNTWLQAEWNVLEYNSHRQDMVKPSQKQEQQ